jgi:catechol 1,2-dioxygenase
MRFLRGLVLLAAAALVPAPGTASGACTPTPPNAQGPFYLPDAPFVERLDRPDDTGPRVELAGRVLVLPDCRPVAGAVLDIWQASAGGVYYNLEKRTRPADYRLRGRVRTGPDGSFHIVTVRPGPYGPDPGSPRPSHIHVTVSAPGLIPLTTQVYFPGDPNNARDDIFQPALLGALHPRGEAPALLSFDFVLVPLRK